MSARYAPLPNPQYSAPDAERELDEAFEDDDDDDDQSESTPLTRAINQATVTERPSPTSGTYDFERDYDCPPPGSPPGPSALALPNTWGNSNGRIPDSPVRQSFPRPSFFRRTLGNVLPTYYAPVPTDSGIRVGGGVDNDGVFANVTAKPVRARTVTTDTGEVHIVPEDSARDAPPTYADAQADTVPPYWETTTVHAPDGGDILVDDLPTGSVFVFAANIFTSFFFQFVGFVLTYLLHTSHAAKFGSRAGLGLTLIQYGFYSRVDAIGSRDGTVEGYEGLRWSPDEPQSSEPPLMSTSPTAPTPTDPSITLPDNFVLGVSSREWVAFLFMTIGWFLLLTSVVGYWRVKHWEQSIRSASNRVPVTPEDISRDTALRRNIQHVFGFGTVDETNPGPQTEQAVDAEVHRIARDLRASGLI